MSYSFDPERFRPNLEGFSPDRQKVERSLAIYSAAIAVGDDRSLERAQQIAQANGTEGTQLYEIMLQSYLFLGFPRMLSAAQVLRRIHSPIATDEIATEITPEESRQWFETGSHLCRLIYGSKFSSLREKVTSMSPEIYRWMIIEGYGKVLSRPGVGLVERELAIIASLLIDDRPRQYQSHILGAINAGAERSLVKVVIEDVGKLVDSHYSLAHDILDSIGDV